MPLVSIIIPTNKRLNFLKKSINSVFEQSYKNWEILIINNQNCKKTNSFVKSLKSKKIRIFPINNKGILARSKNLGIKKSRGEWIAFLDDDDTWYPDKLSTCLSYAKNYKVEFIHHPLHIDKENNFFFKKIIYRSNTKLEEPFFLNLILHGNFIAQSSVFVKKKLLVKVNLLPKNRSKYGWEDFYTWLKCTKYCKKFYFINKALGTCWVGKGTISSLDKLIDNYKNFKNFYGSFLNRKYQIDVNNLWWIAYHSSLYYFKKRKYDLAYKKIENIYTSPFKIRLRVIYIKIFCNLYNLKQYLFSFILNKVKKQKI